jgi:hypothetical protein
MDSGRFGPEVADRAAGNSVNRTGTVRKVVQLAMRVVMVVAAVTAVNVGVAYAGEECSYESSSPPPSDTSNSGNPGDPNNSDSYSGGFGTNWSDQDQNNFTGSLELKPS